MVTGIECAGLVLGIFPLVIEALRFYCDGLQKLRNSRKYISILSKCLFDLVIEETKFNNTWHRIVGLIDPYDWKRIYPQINIESLSQRPQALSGSGVELTTILTLALTNFDGAAVRNFEKAVEEIGDLLKVMAKDFLEFVDEPQQRDFLKTGNFGTQKSLQKVVKMLIGEIKGDSIARDEQLFRIHQRNNDLSNLVGGEYQGKILACVRSSQNPSNHSKFADSRTKLFNVIQSEVKALHTTVQEGFRGSSNQQCTCEVPHRAALRLDVLDVICDTSNSNRLRDDYRFQISFEMGSTGENKTCGFCDLDIRMLDTSGGLEDAVYMGHASPVVDPVLPGTSIAQVLYAELEESETMPSKHKLNSAKKRNLLSRAASSLAQTGSRMFKRPGTDSKKHQGRRRSIDTPTSLLPTSPNLDYPRQSASSRPTSAHTITSMASTQPQQPRSDDSASSVPQIVVSDSDAPRCHMAIAGVQGDHHPSSQGCQTCTRPNNNLVSSLCYSLKATMAITDNTTHQSCIGILPSTLGHRFRVCPGMRKTSNSPPANPAPLMPLCELIMKHSQSQGRLPSRLLRLKLAVLLGSSVMQLHGTGWMKDLWSSGDIYFEAASNMQSQEALLAQPRVQKAFHNIRSSDDKTEPEEPMVNNSDNWASGLIHYGNSMLFSLGIVLIELYYWKPWQVLQGPRTKHDALMELVEELNEWAGEDYQTAVQRCIQGLAQGRRKLEEEEFKKTVYEQIVAPLEEELKTFAKAVDVRKLFEVAR